MIYNENEYKVKYYINSKTGEEPSLKFVFKLDDKSRIKVEKYIEYLKLHKGYLDEPYSRHITGKIRELRVDFFNNRHRIFYFTFLKKTIVLLHGFTKNTQKTPTGEIKKALENYNDAINNPQLYE